MFLFSSKKTLKKTLKTVISTPVLTYLYLLGHVFRSWEEEEVVGN